MPATRSSTRMRQTRLTFTPLPSSSPAIAKSLNHIPDRAASVRYSDVSSPTGERHFGDEDGHIKASAGNSNRLKMKQSPRKNHEQARILPVQDPLTPVASSQIDDQRAKQSAVSESLSSSSDSNIEPLSRRKGVFSTVRHPSTTPLLRTPTPKSRLKQTSPVGNGKISEGTTSRLSKENSLSSLGETSSEDDLPLLSRRKRRKASDPILVSSDEESDLIFMDLPSPRRVSNTSSTPKKQQRTPVTPPNVTSLQFLLGSSEKAPISSSRYAHTSSVEEDDSSVMTAALDGSIEGPIVRKDAHSRDGSEDDVVSPLKRRRLIRPLGRSLLESNKASQRQADDDIQEDLEAIEESEIRKNRTRSRVANGKKEKAQKQLELLKQRRASHKVTEPISDTEHGPARIYRQYDNTPTSQSLSNNSSELSDEEVESGTEAVRQALRTDVDKYDEDFVTDDDESPFGAPGLEEIPLHLTMHAHKKPKEHFKDAVEWMVNKKLNPAFARNDPIYQAAFKKLDDEVQGYAGSRFFSTVWTGDFARALKSRPEFIQIEVPTAFRNCDACNRSGHPAKFLITFGGKAYHHETLESVSEDEDDEDDDGDVKSRDSRGNPIPSTDKEYFVGRVCKGNAEIAHSLLHWRFQLNEWVLDWLKNEGHTTPKKIVERENWSIKRRGDYANGVVDEMEIKGEIKALYRDFKINLDTARNYKPPRYSNR